MDVPEGGMLFRKRIVLTKLDIYVFIETMSM